jgi:3',5'-cyclic-AMP phosphodiesterase
MRFIHITDTHIGPSREHRFLGHESRAALEALVYTINCLPFEPDFILHTGDISDDASEESYQIARSLLQQLKTPVFYVLGNHDDPQNMQRVFLNKHSTTDRYDYYAKLNGVGLAVFDTRVPGHVFGTLTDDQLAALRDLCKPSGPPLIIALHHQPVVLDVDWLDNGWGENRMLLECHEAFQEAIAPARDRIRGVFFGHVHRSCQVVHDGILYCAPPSACAQIISWPTSDDVAPAFEELPGFNIVTVTDNNTIVRQHTFVRPY